MKMTMTLTLDGLVRAMRWKAHSLAEEAEQGYARERLSGIGKPLRRTDDRAPERVREDRDDRSGR